MAKDDIYALDLKLRHLRELLDKQEEYNEKALRLHNIEIERRLDGLNNEAARIKEILSASVTRESYDIQHSRVVEDIRDLKDFKSKQEGKSTVWNYIIPAVISLIIGLALWGITQGL